MSFVYRMRVRYHECDGQEIVFNTRYGDYVDVAALEFTRELFGQRVVSGSFAWRLIAQEAQWKAPARFDDVLDLKVLCTKTGTTSFTLQTTITQSNEQTLCAQYDTTYVCVDQEGLKQPLSSHDKERLVSDMDCCLDASGTRIGC